ncbi:hypothetical protein P43SY_011868 [Pythium insidiosum]|uniref:Uncharacterized protein n=1 Tax=Pythium insidiosum TaxID=114742 RepID=A0AAD5Q1A3_PYTIN|nr:hypothetical protein P43SY_011868 [Pythium insidiosum]
MVVNDLVPTFSCHGGSTSAHASSATDDAGGSVATATALAVEEDVEMPQAPDHTPSASAGGSKTSSSAPPDDDDTDLACPDPDEEEKAAVPQRHASGAEDGEVLVDYDESDQDAASERSSVPTDAPAPAFAEEELDLFSPVSPVDPTEGAAAHAERQAARPSCL